MYHKRRNEPITPSRSEQVLILPTNKIEQNLLSIVQNGLVTCEQCGVQLEYRLTHCPMCHWKNYYSHGIEVTK